MNTVATFKSAKHFFVMRTVLQPRRRSIQIFVGIFHFTELCIGRAGQAATLNNVFFRFFDFHVFLPID
jgi:hypothetical protein